jgi:hypothetical protein
MEEKIVLVLQQHQEPFGAATKLREMNEQRLSAHRATPELGCSDRKGRSTKEEHRE